MKKFMIMFGIATILSCAQANATGLLYTNATYPVTATGADVGNLSDLKKGKASTNNILFLFETGDASIDRAAKKGGIKKISHIDLTEKTIFLFWRKLTVTVYGE